MNEKQAIDLLNLIKKQNEILIAMHKSIDNLSKLFEKYDTDYQIEIENQGDIPLG